jgi:anaerobic magnesium-protoporphyrin IX monomethyl ester cyclase
MRYLTLVNPPEREGYTNERTLSGGLGVARKRKLWEKPQILLPPHDLLLTAAVAEARRARVEIVDLMLDRYPGDAAVTETCRRIQQHTKAGEIPIVGVRISMPSLPADIEFANRLKVAHPEMHIFLFGSAIMSTLDHWAADTRADAVLYGEPEAVIGPMLDAEGNDWTRAPGVIVPSDFRAMSGKALYDGSVQGRFREWIMNTDVTSAPFPAYHLVPMERYSPTGKTEDVGVYLSASRGCPIGCTMCPYMLHEGRPLRAASSERVLAEMEWLNQTLGYLSVALQRSQLRLRP